MRRCVGSLGDVVAHYHYEMWWLIMRYVSSFLQISEKRGYTFPVDTKNMLEMTYNFLYLSILECIPPACGARSLVSSVVRRRGRGGGTLHPAPAINQSIIQSINHSFNQTIIQSINKSINQSFI